MDPTLTVMSYIGSLRPHRSLTGAVLQDALLA
jgi:hypothetical protein